MPWASSTDTGRGSSDTFRFPVGACWATASTSSRVTPQSPSRDGSPSAPAFSRPQAPPPRQQDRPARRSPRRGDARRRARPSALKRIEWASSTALARPWGMPVPSADELRQAVVDPHGGVLEATPSQHGALEHLVAGPTTSVGSPTTSGSAARDAPGPGDGDALGFGRAPLGDHSTSTQWASALRPRLGRDADGRPDSVSSGS